LKYPRCDIILGTISIRIKTGGSGRGKGDGGTRTIAKTKHAKKRKR